MRARYGGTYTEKHDNEIQHQDVYHKLYQKWLVESAYLRSLASNESNVMINVTIYDQTQRSEQKGKQQNINSANRVEAYSYEYSIRKKGNIQSKRRRFIASLVVSECNETIRSHLRAIYKHRKFKTTQRCSKFCRSVP